MIKQRSIFGSKGVAAEVLPCPELQQRAARPRPAGELEEPTATDLVYNFAGAMERWARAGFKTVSREQYVARAETCSGCEHWRPKARMGLGKCAAPGCGCTKLKRWLASEKCPVGKW